MDEWHKDPPPPIMSNDDSRQSNQSVDLQTYFEFFCSSVIYQINDDDNDNNDNNNDTSDGRITERIVE